MSSRSVAVFQPYALVFLRGCHVCFHDANAAQSAQNLEMLHQSMLALLDEPEREKHIKWIFVEFFISSSDSAAVSSTWIIFSSSTRIPRTSHRFRGLIYQKLYSFEPSTPDMRIRVITNRGALAQFCQRVIDENKSYSCTREVECRESILSTKVNGYTSPKSTLDFIRSHFRCYSIFDNCDSFELPPNLRCIRPEDLLQEYLVDATKNGMLLLSFSIDRNSNSLKLQGPEPFLPIIFPNDAKSSSGTWITLSQYRQRPHITCSRLINAMASLVESE